MKNEDIVITSAFRTAIGSFKGSLLSQTAPQLGKVVIEKCLSHSNLNGGEIDTVFMGQVLQTGSGQNPARQAAISSGIPKEKTATTINQVCGSGLSAISLAYNSLKCEDGNIIVAGGQESMSNAPHYANLRNIIKIGDTKIKESMTDINFQDTMIVDGLWDAYNHYHMGVTAENVAQKFQIRREEQDNFAFNSQKKAIDAIKTNKFKDEIVPIKIKEKDKEIIFDKDEYPKEETTLQKLSSLKPVFKKGGTVTAGNSSGLNDGASAVILMTRKKAEEKKIKPLARIVSWAQCGVDPSIMGIGPISATKLALQKAGWKKNELDLIESNEAFASQSIVVAKEMGFTFEKLNVNGGAIALGHPIGASGARILVTLIHEMQKRKVRKGLATLCIGGGMGIAMCIER